MFISITLAIYQGVHITYFKWSLRLEWWQGVLEPQKLPYLLDNNKRTFGKKMKNWPTLIWLKGVCEFEGESEINDMGLLWAFQKLIKIFKYWYLLTKFSYRNTMSKLFCL